jgi:hypothetical protein
MRHKLLGYVALVFVLFYVINNPTAAAVTAHHIGTALAHAGTSVGTFLSSFAAGGGQ